MRFSLLTSQRAALILCRRGMQSKGKRRTPTFCPLLFFVPLLLLSPYPAHSRSPEADTLFVTRFGDTVTASSWDRSRRPDSSCRMDTAAALFGRYGLRLGGAPYSALVKRTPSRDSFYFRFYFRYQPVQTGKERGFKGRAGFMAVTLSNALQARQPKSFLWYGLAQADLRGPVRFGVQLSTSQEHRSDTLLSLPVEPGRAYCSEVSVRFGPRDTVTVIQRLDNRDSATLVRHYPFAREFIEVSIENYGAIPGAPEIHLDGFALSDRPLFALAQEPREYRDTLVRDTAWLLCAPYASGYRGESAVRTEWRLYGALTGPVPLFATEQTDPAQLTRAPVPFPLDTGNYSWQMRFQNSFGSWSGWSRSRPLRREGPPNRTIALTEVCVLDEKGNEPVLRLETGRRYRMTARFSDDSRMADFGFLIGQLSHESYVLPNPGNKGGPFLPDVNYPLHATWRMPDTLVLIERQENSLRSRYVENREGSVYQFPARENSRLDTAQRSLSIGFRLLERARPGRWFLTVSVWHGPDKLSNILRIPLKVEMGAHGHSPWRFRRLAILLVTGGVVAFAFFRRRKGVRAGPPDTDMERLREYIRRNIVKKITTADICKDLRWPERKFYEVCRRNEVSSLPKLLNQIRIDLAKTLLKTTDKNVSEVAYEVGFSEPKYFIQVFREMEGVTPGDFREKV